MPKPTPLLEALEDERSHMVNKQLLEQLAERGQMTANEFLKGVPRDRGDYVDFYSAAALLQAGYVFTDSIIEISGTEKRGTLGFGTRETAIFLQQLLLPKDASFKIDGCPRESACDFSVTFFITAAGYLKLEEINKIEANRRQKRLDYLMSFLVAILAAVLLAYFFHYFAVQRAGIASPIKENISINKEAKK